MYRVIEELSFQGQPILMLRAEPGYYGWGYELPELLRDGRPVTCVQFDSHAEALDAACDEIAFLLEFA